jgi:hypothetical protein
LGSGQIVLGLLKYVVQCLGPLALVRNGCFGFTQAGNFGGMCRA